MRRLLRSDCIIKKSSEYRRVEFERRRRAVIEGFDIWIVSKEDLIVSKLAWAHDSHFEFQLRDVKNLLASGYDAEYLGQWTRKLGLNDLFQECLNE
jgi:hypothetical protein